MMDWQRKGKDPDYRFTLANERTYLAWIRTALAILAGAVALHQLTAGTSASRIVAIASVALTLVSAILAVGGYRHWKANEIAMRHSQTLPPSLLMPFLAFVVLAGSVAAAIAVFMLPR